MKLKLLLGTLICSSISFAQVPSYVSTNGLVGWWPFNGNANDESNNTNNGTVNGATLTTDRNSVANSAYNFNGTSDFIQIAHDATLGFGTNQISISLWVNIANYSTNPSYNKIGISKQTGDGTTQTGLNVWYTTGAHGLRIRNGSGGNFGGVSNNQPIALLTWTHVVYVWDGVNGYFYENGILANSVNSPGAAIGANTVPLLFGKPNWSNVNAEPFAGKLDDIAIYNRPLTACEIQDLYSASSNSLTGVTQSGALLTSEISSAQYQWLDCDNSYAIINGETNQSYTPANTGNYAVEVTFNGCADTSACYLVDYTGINENNAVKMNLHPNPASNSITIQSESFEDVIVMDLLGSVVLTESKEQETKVVDLNSLTCGTYFIRQGQSVVKFIKQ